MGLKLTPIILDSLDYLWDFLWIFCTDFSWGNGESKPRLCGRASFSISHIESIHFTYHSLEMQPIPVRFSTENKLHAHMYT